MKGVILAGGLATRLRPLTAVTNKHLLPVYNKPMIYYPLEMMKRIGMKEVLLITSGGHVGDFANLLLSGEEFGLRLYYAIQQNPTGGIADGLKLAEEFAHNEPIMVILGDNIFNFDLTASIKRFNDTIEKDKKGAMVFGVHREKLAQQYGVIEMDNEGKVISIEEKPEHPKSDIAQTGIYVYDNRVFDFTRTLKPSDRGQLEVTDLNNMYLAEHSLMCELIDWWVDAGTSHDELLQANVQVAEFVKQGKL
ncbi:NTP transferase domain-containing protein [Candidatus Gottesmanbacteria bacterium]|nr:NTP transferase domain-containing protein [Candidatus Gottesmanbacteria bacterium]